MRHDSLDAWLAWQESLNPRGIELGLARARRVLARMNLADPPYRVLTVGGTNGKGSVASLAASMLSAAGLSTGRYLSPHIRRYNERVAINGIEAADAMLCDAFEVVDEARGDEPLTYFEFGTLAALEVFRRESVDVAVLEVGLGGRLDAVNAIDPDVSVVVSIGIDHVDWLGGDIENIAREKAGIFRPGIPAIFGAINPPAAILEEAARIGASLKVFGRDFHVERDDEHWRFRSGSDVLPDLPAPPLAGVHQYANAATAIAAVRLLLPVLPSAAVRSGIAATSLPGRLQRLGTAPPTVIDVGHNADAAARIAAFLQSDPRPTHAVLGMLSDKDAAGFVHELAPQVSHWHFASLVGPRGQSADALARRLADAGLELPHTRHESVAAAASSAAAAAGEQGRVLVTGSFHTVADFFVYFENADTQTRGGG